MSDALHGGYDWLPRGIFVNFGYNVKVRSLENILKQKFIFFLLITLLCLSVSKRFKLKFVVV